MGSSRLSIAPLVIPPIAPLIALSIAVVLTALAAVDAHAMTCVKPTRPIIPNGAVASNAEMVAARAAVSQYQDQMNAYLTCVDNAFAAARREGEETLRQWNQAADSYNQHATQ